MFCLEMIDMLPRKLAEKSGSWRSCPICIAVLPKGVSKGALKGALMEGFKGG